MTRITQHSAEDEQPTVLPPDLAAILRPELSSLADEIITAIRDKIPEYARPIDGPYGQIMRTGVEQALTSFVDHRPLLHPPARTDPGRPVRRPRRAVRHGNGAAGHAAAGKKFLSGQSEG